LGDSKGIRPVKVLALLVVTKEELEQSFCPKRMRSPGINGEGELRGNRLTQVHLEKWPLKRSVCVCAGGDYLTGALHVL